MEAARAAQLELLVLGAQGNLIVEIGARQSRRLSEFGPHLKAHAKQGFHGSAFRIENVEVTQQNVGFAVLLLPLAEEIRDIRDFSFSLRGVFCVAVIDMDGANVELEPARLKRHKIGRAIELQRRLTLFRRQDHLARDVAEQDLACVIDKRQPLHVATLVGD